MVQVEFLRKSNNGRVTLVLDANAPPVRSHWAVMDTREIAAAVENLREREEIPKSAAEKIGRWQTGDASPANFIDLPAWAAARGADAVIWTALPFKFDEMKTRPSADDVAGYLAGLTGRMREDAERYVRRAPPQVDTPYRRVLESRLGWTSKESD